LLLLLKNDAFFTFDCDELRSGSDAVDGAVEVVQWEGRGNGEGGGARVRLPGVRECNISRVLCNFLTPKFVVGY
jgi:hypothetical protein